MIENVMHHPVLKKRSEMHWARKIWHIGMVFLMFVIWTLTPEKVSLSILAIAWVAFVPLDFLRHTSKSLNDWVVHAFKPIMRQNEVKRLAGTTYLLSGVALVAFLFPRPITSLTLLFLAFADPIASYFGIRFGRDKIFGHKSLQGTLAAYLVCASVSLIYAISLNQPLDRAIVFSLVAGAVGALAELVPVAKLDDNFTLPVFSAVGLYFLFHFFGFFPSGF